MAKPAKAADAQPETAKTPTRNNKAAEAKPKKLSLLAAAYQVLKDAGEPMDCKAIVEAASQKGLWTSPAGRTPHATLYSAILRELAAKGAQPLGSKKSAGASSKPSEQTPISCTSTNAPRFPRAGVLSLAGQRANRVPTTRRGPTFAFTRPPPRLARSCAR
jgi:hypothetical protein